MSQRTLLFRNNDSTFYKNRPESNYALDTTTSRVSSGRQYYTGINQAFFPFPPVLPFFNFDQSSVSPCFRPKIGSTNLDVRKMKVMNPLKISIPDQIFEAPIFRIPPVSKRIITVKEIKRASAKPHILAPEEI
jgi:hypothetical protein